jgi:hypothetical protein
MPADPRDYKVELSAGATGEAGASPAPPAGSDRAATPAATPSRPFLSVHFACCGAYQRVYRAADGTHYAGRCPRCGKPVRFAVGDGGTTSRSFTVL